MAVAYFDCFAGAAGDMIVAALLDAGCPFDALQAGLAKLLPPGTTLRADKVARGGLAGTKFNVDAPNEHVHRNLAVILDMIAAADLPARPAERAEKIFTRLAEAEARVHGVSAQEIHFHEIGAVDSIADIVGACVALELLGVDRVLASTIPVGTGTVQCAHGLLPVPAPATAALLAGVKTWQLPDAGEVTTPTGAAVLTALAESFGPMPEMEVSAVGYGAGTMEHGPRPNLLRVFIGRESADGQADSVVELSANLDDCTGQVLGATIERLLAAGAMDAWASPIVMKKSRPAWMLSALSNPADAGELERLIFQETPTLGVRRHTMSRSKLAREMCIVETAYGPIRVKVGSLDGQVVSASPEYADCVSAAQSHHVSVREVIAAAQTQYRREHA